MVEIHNLKKNGGGFIQIRESTGLVAGRFELCQAGLSVFTGKVKALQAKGLLQSHLIELETACIIAVFNFFQGLVKGRTILRVWVYQWCSKLRNF